ncbi:glycosyltransferase family 2 protein [Sphingomonas sp. PL-96]|uniref:glycosyltransferase family 2 protein n=1 Tax=Sphingomonas sp. PL-96 TaxID=2887201 RepID=UPI001E30DBA1|nr:glycosyltransferase family 2 protein [Sphingomonas sp. PL-96]MCC2978227.1 glycosyltransferase family 2 protein [Sphingomonas sp. PL-96]
MTQPLSVIIVNYRTPDLTIKCVRSLLHHGIATPEDIIVVENASGDDSMEVLRPALNCTLVQATENGGYGAGVNLGMQQARHDLVLCLNPDTYFTDSDVLNVGRIFDAEPSLGLLGLDLRYPGGERQFPARRDYSLLDVLLRRTRLGQFGLGQRIVDRHLMKDAWDGGIFSADWVMGTGFVVRRTAFEAVGGMDTDYFLYMEDVDLCLRLRKAGWRVAAVPGIQLVHDHQRASGQKLLSRAARLHLQALGVFMRKHHVPILPPSR